MKIGGKQISNWWVVGGAAGVGAVIYFYRKAGSSTSSSSSGSSAIDPVTGLPYSQDNQIDPATGMTYLAEATEYGSVQAAEEAVSSGAGLLGSGESGGGLDSGFPTGWEGGGTTPPTGTTYATNAQWAQAVQAGLVGLGYSSESVGAAVGLLFAQVPLNNPTYVTILQTAFAEYGPPPQGSYSIIPGTGGGGGGTGGKPSVAVPDVVGQTVNQAQTRLTAAGLSVNTNTAPDKPGYDRKVTAENPKAGTSVPTGTHVGLTWQYVKS